MYKPILFNTKMVKAILDGRKTVTRRCIKPQPTNDPLVDPEDWKELLTFVSAPCQKGDILWVRETWHKYTKRIGEGETCRIGEFFGYKASVANSEDAEEKWRPSIHMPKEAARIFLKVTDVRVERLNDMRTDDFLNEGIDTMPEAYNDPDNLHWQLRSLFETLWNSTIKPSDLDTFGWNANPYVWVIEFERCEQPEDFN